uniref:C-SKI_SMAD_bind domain-containing protein n=1 Tax=Macrostomum lignano TaxID=282301 RepID=A0A1I8F4G2_9PLAT
SLTGLDGACVYHRCFGKQRGFLIPRLYTCPEAPCIVCSGCSGLLSPAQFVGHVHWRLYLMLDRRLAERESDSQERTLEAVKGRFEARKRPGMLLPVANGNHHGVGPESEAKRHKLLNNSRRCHIENGIATGAIRPISPPMTLEESIASDWESLTDWGEGHLPEKATPQFLAMVEKVKSGYQARIDGLQQVVDRLTGRCAQAEVDRDELARLRRQVEELRSPDVRRLRAKYDAQKEELQRLRAAVQGYGDGDVNGCSNGDGKLGNGSVEAAIEEEGAEEEPPALELQCAASNGHQLHSPQ